ncbi:MAG: hypothetical protein JST54_13175 [Deltaproteobacteria bacterium]|nr:hypothetical protein [Deltaproteobacteria bacterium]
MFVRRVVFAGLFVSAAGCAQIDVVNGAQPFHTAEEYAPNVQRLEAGENKEDARRYWLEYGVKAIENAPLANDPDLPLACLKAPDGEIIRKNGTPEAHRLLDQDIRYYALINQSHNLLAAHSAELVAVMKVADGEYAHKEEYKELALRAVVAYERLLDHHRYLLAQLKKSGCLSDTAPSTYKFSEDALARYQGLLKDIKTSTDATSDLTALAQASFAKYAEPLKNRRQYAGRVEMLSFMHRIYAESTAEAEQICGQLLTAPKAPPWQLFACGYVYEKAARYDDAKHTYDRLKSVSTDNLEYVARAKKRTNYIDDYAAPLADPALGSTSVPNLQAFLELK